MGTRPEIIKVAPVVRECHERNLPVEIIHTGQHYSYEMDRLIFEQVDLDPPHINLHIGSGTHAEETSRAMLGLERVFMNLRPRLVLVQGDTNSTLAGALAASKLNIPIGHIEAGLRSFDRKMPEETNRMIADHVSDMLFAPTQVSAENLRSEGILADRILVTGNTIVDSIDFAMRLIGRNRSPDISFAPEDEYMLMTLHRQENVDSEIVLRSVIGGVEKASRVVGRKVIFPAHPRTVKKLSEFGISLPESIVVIKPVGYLNFLALERSAQLILTDSGGIQEEACVLKVPCVTLRRRTERPETIKVGANFLAGTDAEEISNGASMMSNASRNWSNPFGDGMAGSKIVDSLSKDSWSEEG